MNKIKTLCNITFEKFALKTAPYKRKCRYHKIQGQEFFGENFFPKGCCPHLYRMAYPYCLSLLYDGKYSRTGDSVRIRCPSLDNSVEFNIKIHYTLPYILRKLKRVVIRFMQLLNIAIEYPDKNIIIDILRANAICPYGLKNGQSFLFNIRNRTELCPASFYAAYPFLFKWAVDQESNIGAREKNLIHCPDPFGVYYEIIGDNINCEDLFLERVEVVDEFGRCPLGHRKGDFFKFEDVIPDHMCVLAFYSIFPYYLTLIHSGTFEWVKKSDCVRVQCPKAEGVIMEVELLRRDNLGEGATKVKVIDVKGMCPKGYKKGDEFCIDSRKQRLCFKAIAGLIPFKVLSKKAGGKYPCIGTKFFLTFKLI